jgi:hypothetical protein
MQWIVTVSPFRQWLAEGIKMVEESSQRKWIKAEAKSGRKDIIQCNLARAPSW